MTVTRRLAAMAAVLLIAMAAAAGPARAQQDICSDPATSCGRLVDPSCLARVGAGALAADGEAAPANCEAQLRTYNECLATVVANCGDGATAPSTAPQPAVGACPPETEARLWDAVKDSDDPLELEVFTTTCPDSPFARIAARRIDALANPPSPPRAAAAPAPAPTKAAPMRPIYAGAYAGVWRNPTMATGGRNEMTITHYDPQSGAITVEAAAEENGVISRGVLTGVIAADGSGQLDGTAAATGLGLWNFTMWIDPSGSQTEPVSTVRGRYRSSAVANPGLVYQGVYEMRRLP